MTPLTAAIVWAVVATGLGITACMGWWRALRWQVQLECMRDDARAKLDRGLKDAGRYIGKLVGDKAEWRAKAIDAEGRLRAIELKRHLSAKHARATQLARQQALRDATTAKLRGVA